MLPQDHFMTPHLYKRTSPRFPYYIYLAAGLFIGLSLVSCSLSPWIKTDGDEIHEVTPAEQAECVHQVNQASKGEVLDQKTLKQRIEQCMLDKGYHRRQWWELNDLHWNVPT
jgi:hypothetical protein